MVDNNNNNNNNSNSHNSNDNIIYNNNAKDINIKKRKYTVAFIALLSFSCFIRMPAVVSLLWCLPAPDMLLYRKMRKHEWPCHCGFQVYVLWVMSVCAN